MACLLGLVVSLTRLDLQIKSCVSFSLQNYVTLVLLVGIKFLNTARGCRLDGLDRDLNRPTLRIDITTFKSCIDLTITFIILVLHSITCPNEI